MLKFLMTAFVVVAVSVGGVRADNSVRSTGLMTGVTDLAGPAFGPQDLPPVDGPGL